MSADSYDKYEGLNRLALDRAGQAEAFDAIGDRYDEAFPHKDGQVSSAAWLAGELPPGSRVLDVGCGTGLPTSHQLAEAGHRVVGIDLSHSMVKLAGDNVPGAEFHRLDVAELRNGSLGGPGSFDGITAYFTLLLLPRAEIPYALRMLHDLLRPGGVMALSMVEADVDDFTIPFLGNSIRVSGFLREDLRRVVRDAGFDIAGEDSYAYAPASTDVPPEIQLFLHLRRA
ncbi:class I SAM-dependent DNA methyltransferase [Streptomyces benahoarensis]|uniref:Methyltransferase domain-containing protein n=1 Tax=Streptomyces benahoarensis TaxID=2595054 RepID=A0A553ZPE2_9ACTN|nr:class I SAM-dependent methyltransferase [Streptomyces benahoarensis]TSB21839.1 methyltransferase domain-containing protein [Streptomyces benahoarensis]TSB43339.1 methyltransferase domain-containing protein [Streptomyces benahoarensis]